MVWIIIRGNQLGNYATAQSVHVTNAYERQKVSLELHPKL